MHTPSVVIIDTCGRPTPRAGVDWLRVPAFVIASLFVLVVALNIVLLSEPETPWLAILAHCVPFVMPWSPFTGRWAAVSLRLWLLAAATSLSVVLFWPGDVQMSPVWPGVAVSASAWLAVWAGWRRTRRRRAQAERL